MVLWSVQNTEATVYSYTSAELHNGELCALLQPKVNSTRAVLHFWSGVGNPKMQHAYSGQMKSAEHFSGQQQVLPDAGLENWRHLLRSSSGQLICATEWWSTNNWLCEVQHPAVQCGDLRAGRITGNPCTPPHCAALGVCTSSHMTIYAATGR